MDEKEVYDKLNKELIEEYSGVCNYISLSKAISHDGYAQILRDIAMEEWTHANHVRSILEDSGKLTDADKAHEWCMKAEDSIKSLS